MKATETQIRKLVQQVLVREQEWSQNVDVEEGKMRDLLNIPEGSTIADEYDSGEELARDLVDAVGDEKEASGMLAFAANVDPEDNIFDDALEAIGEIDFEE